MNACPQCHHAHVAGDAMALSRFAGVTGYRTSDGEIHATREDAQAWLCERRQVREVSAQSTPTTPTHPSDTDEETR